MRQNSEPFIMQRLDCSPQNYDWGKVGEGSLVYQLLKDTHKGLDTTKPYAELWIGDHDKAPSRIVATNERLCESEFGAIPFLFKVLSVEKPLSIQLHPSLEQAKELYKNGGGLYPDANHKPEMGLFISQSQLLFGFREFSEIAENLQKIPALHKACSPASDKFIANPISENLKEVVRCLLSHTPEEKKQLTDELEAEKSKIVDIDVYEHIVRTFPGDTGVFFLFLLNVINGQPGTAAFIPAGICHAYLRGDLYEAMAVSDNVIRAGMTPKPIDIPNLLKYTVFEPRKPLMIKPIIEGPLTTYKPPEYISEFALQVLRLNAKEKYNLKIPATSIFLVEKGPVCVDDKAYEHGDIVAIKEGEYNCEANDMEISMIICHGNL